MNWLQRLLGRDDPVTPRHVQEAIDKAAVAEQSLDAARAATHEYAEAVGRLGKAYAEAERKRRAR